MPFVDLKALVVQGLITPETIIENDEGKSLLAASVNTLGLSLRMAPPPVAPPAALNDVSVGPPIGSNPFLAAPPQFFPVDLPFGDDTAITAPPPRKINPRLLYITGGVVVLVLAVALTGVVWAKHRHAKRERQAIEQAQRELQETERAERERREIEARAEEERKKKEEAERIAAEQAERERREAQAKANAATEEARKKREEAQKEAERKRREFSAAEKEVNDQLTVVPDVWPDIALPSLRIGKPAVLEGTEFLWNVKDRVTVSIVPFTHLLGSGILQESQPHKMNFFHKNGGDGEQIIGFSLKENGVSYEWNTETLQKYDDLDSYRKWNCLFLSVLRIEINGFAPKEIALWTPLVYTAAEFSSSSLFKTVGGSVRFTLWQPDGNGKEFAPTPGAEMPMLLDFDEISYGRDRTIYKVGAKTFERSAASLAYTPTMPRIDGATINCELRLTQGKEPRLYVDFNSDVANTLETQKRGVEADLKKVQDELNRVRPETDSINTRIKRLEKSNKDISLKLDHLKKQVRLHNIPPDKRRAIEREITELENQFRWNLSPLNPNGIPAELQRKQATIPVENQLESRKNDVNNKLRAKQIELGVEKKKLEQIRADHFSLYLLKNGTSASEVHLPEKRLLLFRVVP